MAQKKRKHGKVESRKAKPVIRFKLGVLLLLIAFAFGGCFALYMISATSDPDYWDREIVGSTEATQESETGQSVPLETSASAVIVNPVPESERTDDARLALCAWVGDISALTTYHQTASEMVFPDAVSGLSESEVRSLTKRIADTDPYAVYFQQQTPGEIDDVRQFFEILREALAETPLYILSALPAEDAETSRSIMKWNAQLFALSDELALHYVDISTQCKNNDGTLAAEFRDQDNLHRLITEEILTHVAD